MTDIPVGAGIDLLAQRAPHATTLTCLDRVTTRAELAVAANRATREFAAGDTVTIGLLNGAPFYAAVIGAWKVGAIPQPVSAKLPPAGLAALVELADPAVVVDTPLRDDTGKFRRSALREARLGRP